MSLSGCLMVSAIGCICIGLVDELAARITVALIWMLIIRTTVVREQRLMCNMIILVMVLLSIPVQSDYIHSGIVDSIFDNYLIIRDHRTRVIAYYSGDADLDDLIAVNCAVGEISAHDNFDVSDFSLWAKGNGIAGSIELREYDVLRKGKSLRSMIYRHNADRKADWVNEFLFGYSQREDAKGLYLITSSGMHVSYLAYLIREVLGFYMYRPKAQRTTCLIMALLAAVFGFPYGFVRCLVFLIFSTLFDDRRLSNSLSIIFLCLYRPYYVHSLAFLLPVCSRLLSDDTQSYDTFSRKALFLLLQLRFYGSCSLTGVIGFNIASHITGLMYVMALICGFSGMPVNLNGIIEWFLKTYERLPQMSIVGRMPLLILAGEFVALDRYCISRHRKHLLIMALLLLVNCNLPLFKPYYTVTQLDIGQGDCAVITVPFSNRAVLIDAGSSLYSNTAEKIIIPYLNSQAIRRADIIISHDDHDHNGSLPYLEEAGLIRKVYDEHFDVLRNGRLEIHDLLQRRYGDNDNDRSLISYFRLGKFGFLYLGDASALVEQQLCEQYGQYRADVIKLSHHGSNSATSDLLLETFQPSLALISAGKNNSYGHPHQQVLQRLQNWQISQVNTADGAVRFIVFSRVMIMVTADNRMGIFIK